MSIVRDKFFFVFNDNPKNYAPDKKSNKFYNFNGRNSVIAFAEISKNGSVSIRPIFSAKGVSVVARPKICKQVGRNEMMIYGERGRKYRFGSLKFN